MHQNPRKFQIRHSFFFNFSFFSTSLIDYFSCIWQNVKKCSVLNVLKLCTLFCYLFFMYKYKVSVLVSIKSLLSNGKIKSRNTPNK